MFLFWCCLCLVLVSEWWRPYGMSLEVFLPLQFFWKNVRRIGICSTLVLLYWLCKAFACADHNKLWKILKETGIPDHLTCLLRKLYEVRKQQLELDMEQQTGFNVKAVYCHPAYLTYMQTTSWETLGWKKHKLESRLPGDISITSDMQMTTPLWQKVKN